MVWTLTGTPAGNWLDQKAHAQTQGGYRTRAKVSEITGCTRVQGRGLTVGVGRFRFRFRFSTAPLFREPVDFSLTVVRAAQYFIRLKRYHFDKPACSYRIKPLTR
jgi:hypothetical protein